MAVRIAPFVTLPTRVNTETSFAPRPAPAAPVERDALFSDGFSNRAVAPVSLGAPETVAMPSFNLPSFKVGSIGEASARNFVSEEAEAPEQPEGKNPLEAGAERFEQGNTLLEQVNGFREFGEDINLDAEARAGALETLDRDIEQYSRVAPNLTGDRQAYAQNLIEDAVANRAEIEGLPEFTDAERAAGSFAEAVEDSPLASAVARALDSNVVKGLGIGAGAIGAVFEGQELYENGDDLAMAEAGGLAQFGVGTVPGTQGIAAFDTLSKLGVEAASAGLEAATGLGDVEASESIYGRGVFTDTAVDGARALVGLGEAAVTGDTSGLDDFRDSVDNGSLFERVLGTAGNFIGATAAAIETGSTQPFSDFADDTERAFGTLGEKPGAPEAAPSEELSNPFSNYEAPREDPGAIPSYELNAPDLGFGESYGQDFVSDFEGGGGGGGGVSGAKEFTYSEE